MAHILILFGTTEGQTRKIANHIAQRVHEKGHEALAVDVSTVPVGLDLHGFDAFIVAGSLHQGKHQVCLADYVRAHGSALHPSAFLSVSLCAVVKDAKHTAEAAGCMEGFYTDTEWRPDAASPVAGALLYTQYDFIKRMLMRMISKREGGETDTTKDHEYTDWQGLDAFIESFLERVCAMPVGMR